MCVPIPIYPNPNPLNIYLLNLGQIIQFVVHDSVDLTAAHPGFLGSSYWAVWSSAHGFTGGSVEQKKE